ncbi:MAG: hypothetical protein IKK57_04580 [Clostridia bacterium]|nr:hypothetical protein [Clostridia bacterium]
MTIRESNKRILTLLGDYLCFTPDAVSPSDVQTYADAHLLSADDAYCACLAARLGLNASDPQDALLIRDYLPHIVRQDSPTLYLNDAYMRTIAPVCGQFGAVELTRETLQPMELFVSDDFRRDSEGRALPQLGWFSGTFTFPALRENGQVWMTVTPNEINTIRPAIRQSRGKVLTYGLGLGYYAFHCLLKPEVTSVTVVEQSPQVIETFRRLLLPAFPHPEKLRIIQADAFEYAAQVAPGEDYDVVFTDIWRDVADGLPLYQRMKTIASANPGPRYLYWMEPTLRCYSECMDAD